SRPISGAINRCRHIARFRVQSFLCFRLDHRHHYRATSPRSRRAERSGHPGNGRSLLSRFCTEGRARSSNGGWRLRRQAAGKKGDPMTNSTPLEQTAVLAFPAALEGAPPSRLPIKARQYFQEGMAHLQSGDANEAVVALSRSIEYAP